MLVLRMRVLEEMDRKERRNMATAVSAAIAAALGTEVDIEEL